MSNKITIDKFLLFILSCLLSLRIDNGYFTTKLANNKIPSHHHSSPIRWLIVQQVAPHSGLFYTNSVIALE
jgi:hypothetical protein